MKRIKHTQLVRGIKNLTYKSKSSGAKKLHNYFVENLLSPSFSGRSPKNWIIFVEKFGCASFLSYFRPLFFKLNRNERDTHGVLKKRIIGNYENLDMMIKIF